MTFGDLLYDLRNRKLNEATTTFFDDTLDLLPMLALSEQRIAGMFGIPRNVVSGSLRVSKPYVIPPTDFLAVVPGGLTVNGWVLKHVTPGELAFYNQVPNTSTGQPRYYSFNPLGPTVFDMSPAPRNSDGIYTLEYVAALPSTRVTTDVPWNGVLPQFHEVISILAAAKAYEKGPSSPHNMYMGTGSSYDISNRWMSMAQMVLEDMAAYLIDKGMSLQPNIAGMIKALQPAQPQPQARQMNPAMAGKR